MSWGLRPQTPAGGRPPWTPPEAGLFCIYIVHTERMISALLGCQFWQKIEKCPKGQLSAKMDFLLVLTALPRGSFGLAALICERTVANQRQAALVLRLNCAKKREKTVRNKN